MPSALKAAQSQLAVVDRDGSLVYWQALAGIIIGYASPLLERFIGRRRCLLFFLVANAVWAGVLSTETPGVTTAALFGLYLGDMFIIFSCTVSLIESLPFHLRFLAPLAIPIASGLATAMCMMLFESFPFKSVCYAAIVLYFAGIAITFYGTEESLCHLIIRNEIGTVASKIFSYEKELCEREGGDKQVHARIAKKIYEDIVFLDTDELSIFFFLRRFFKSLVVLETLLACLFAITAGLMDFEMLQLMAEHFANVYFVGYGRLLAYAVCSFVMLATRNARRVHVLSLLQCCILFMIALRRMMMQYDNKNVCSDHQFVFESQFYGAFVLSSFIDGLVMSLQTTVILHFLETAPSILRMTAVSLIMIPVNFIQTVAFFGFKIGGMKSLYSFPLVYTLHLIAACVTLIRMGDNIPFSLYLIDLLPLSDRPSHSSNKRGEDDNLDPKTMDPRTLQQAAAGNSMMQGRDVSTRKKLSVFSP